MTEKEREIAEVEMEEYIEKLAKTIENSKLPTTTPYKNKWETPSYKRRKSVGTIGISLDETILNYG